MAVAGRIGSDRIGSHRNVDNCSPSADHFGVVAYFSFFAFSAASTDIDNALVVVLGVFYALVAARCTKQLPQHGQQVCLMSILCQNAF